MYNKKLVFCLIALILFAFTFIGGCAVNQATGKRQLILVSESQEIAIGLDADKSITSSLGLYPDSSLQQYIRNLGLQMAVKCERPNLPWSFKVVDDPIVNAFALPGGYIYVTRGILAHLNNEAELSGVIGHEIGHVTGKHSVARMSSAQIAQVGLGVGTILQPKLEKFSQIVGTGLGLLFLKYGRDDENEADMLGLRYMQKIDEDPREMVGVMAMLDNVSQAHGGGRIPEWLSTHPNPGNRQGKIQSFVDTISYNLEGTVVGRDRYLKMIDGITWGADPRQGYFKENLFYHPDLKFRIAYPSGWQTANQVQAVVAVNQNQDAIIQLTLSEGSSPLNAAQQFAAQEGIVSSGIRVGNVNGLPANWADFSIQTQEGALRGTVYYIAYDNRIFQLLGYGSTQGWTNNERVIIASILSFNRLTDKRILAVKPWRIDVVTLNKSMTLQQFMNSYKSPATIETIALINRLQTTTTLKTGQKIKHIVGEPLP